MVEANFVMSDPLRPQAVKWKLITGTGLPIIRVCVVAHTFVIPNSHELQRERCAGE